MIKVKKKVFYITLITLVICGAFISCDNTIDRHIKEGKQALSSNDYEKAITDFGDALKENPENIEAQNLLDMVKNYNKAKEDYDEGNLDGANRNINEISSEYYKYKIKNDVDKLKIDIKSKQENIDKINNEVQNANKLMEEKKYLEAKGKLTSIDLKGVINEQRTTIEEYIKKIDICIKEKMKKDLEQVKKVEEAKRKEFTKKQNIPKKQEEIKSNQVKSNSGSDKVTTKKKECVYINKTMGVKIIMPGSWDGYFRVHTSSDESRLGVYFNPKVKPLTHEALIFYLEKSTRNTNFLDDARVFKINGVNYVIGGPTDCQVPEEDNEDKEAYLKISRMKSQVKILPL